MNYLDRQKIQKGEIGPDVSLTELMALVAVDFAIDFREKVKTFELTDDSGIEPVGINQDANQYKQGILRICNQVLTSSGPGGLVNTFVRCFVTILGRTNYTYAQVGAATQTQWEGFMNDNILEIFEHIAGVTKEGKAEYDNI